MPSRTVRARAPRGAPVLPRMTTDPDILAGYLSDAGSFPGGHAAGIASPATEAELAAILRASAHVLPIGAQSSLTGGATPAGDVLVSTARFKDIERLGHDRVRAGAGVTLIELEEALDAAGCWYPPVPTYRGATVGGVVATNAAGAATFKYGATRQWVEAITVMLGNGDVLDVTRGEVCAAAPEAPGSGVIRVERSDGDATIPIPTYQLPRVPKVSAGYFTAAALDLIDLFIGSEGTLGIVTSATLRVLPSRPAECLAFVTFADRDRGLEFVAALRAESIRTREAADRNGLDVSAVEHLDARSLAVLREERLPAALGVTLPDSARLALLITIELPPHTTAAEAYEQIGRAAEETADSTPLIRFCRLLAGAGALDQVEFAAPGDRRRAAQLLALREGVPAAVNQRIARAQRDLDPRIAKTAADMIVPFDRLPALLDFYDEGFRRRGLDAAVWGHISDGNLHPNVIPRSFADVVAGREAILEFGREVIRLGGSPLAEHGVGRNPIKQALLRELYGDEGVAQMRRVKRALDPEWKLARGVIFSAE